jgi:hypothetical protein
MNQRAEITNHKVVFTEERLNIKGPASLPCSQAGRHDTTDSPIRSHNDGDPRLRFHQVENLNSRERAQRTQKRDRECTRMDTNKISRKAAKVKTTTADGPAVARGYGGQAADLRGWGSPRGAVPSRGCGTRNRLSYHLRQPCLRHGARECCLPHG